MIGYVKPVKFIRNYIKDKPNLTIYNIHDEDITSRDLSEGLTCVFEYEDDETQTIQTVEVKGWYFDMDWTVDVCRSAELQVIQNKSNKMIQEELAKLEHELEQLMVKRDKASERMQTLLAEHDAAEQAIQEMAERDEATGRIVAEIFDEHDDSKISLLNEEVESLVWNLLWIEGELLDADDDLEQVNQEIARKQRIISSRQKIQGEIESLHAANTLEKYINKSSVGQLVHTESIDPLLDKRR